MISMQVLMSIITIIGVSITNAKTTTATDSQNSVPALLEALVHQLKLENAKNQTILVHTITSETDYKWIQYLQSYSPVVLNYFSCLFGDSKTNYGATCNVQNPKNVDKIIIITNTWMVSTNRFIDIVHNLKIELKWSKSPIFHVIESSMNGNCEIAKLYLKKLWIEHRILTAYYFCVDSKSKVVQIYTYNPYKNQASKNWQYVKSDEEYNGNKWTLFVQNYSSDSNNLGFDFKRTDLPNEYFFNVRCYPYYVLNRKFIMGKNIKSDKIPNNSALLSFEPLRAIASALKINFNIIDNSQYQRTSRKNDKDISMKRSGNIFEGESSSIYYFETNWRQYEIGIIDKGYKTPLENMSEFYGTWTILFTIWILFIKFIVIWFVKKKNIAFAVFDVIRLLTNTSIHLEMKTLSLRIFFATIFIYFLVIQATFAGHLAKFLTKNAPRRSVRTLSDLDNSYSIFTDRLIQRTLPISIETKNVDELKTCLVILKTTDRAACIWHYKFLMNDIKNHPDILISRPFSGTYFEYEIASDWPLLPRVNKVIKRLWESGLWKHWEVLDYRRYFYKYLVEAATLTPSYTVRPIKLNDLKFFFFMLASGLTIATVAFCTEIYWSKRMITKSESIKFRWNLIGKIRESKCSNLSIKQTKTSNIQKLKNKKHQPE